MKIKVFYSIVCFVFLELVIDNLRLLLIFSKRSPHWQCVTVQLNVGVVHIKLVIIRLIRLKVQSHELNFHAHLHFSSFIVFYSILFVYSE